MKAASGELSLTVITIVAIGLVLGIFTAIMPLVKNKIASGFGEQASTTGDTSVSDLGPGSTTGGAGGTEAGG